MKHIQYFLTVALLTLTATLSLPSRTFAAFGLSTSTDYYTVDTGAGLVFKVRRTEGPNANHQSPGDIMSMVYNGVEYQDQNNGTQINSGFDWIYNYTNLVNVSADVYGTNYVKITVVCGDPNNPSQGLLTHYYIARNGYPNIYMATYFNKEPEAQALCRYIVRIPKSLLPNGPEPSEINETTYTVESGDIFGLPNGETRSKHYSNHRMIDWKYTGATGNGVGIFIERDSQEGGSGGPFYRSLINQGGGNQELTYCLNYGEAQTEAFRPGTLNGLYALVFTDGHQPNPDIDYSWVDSAGLNLTNWVPRSGRGCVTGTASGIPDGFETVVGFANATAQYWAKADANGNYITEPMIPGTYNVTLYKQELEVATDSVTITAGNTNTLDIASAEPNPAIIWRIGDRDGTPNGFMNADKVTWMHPSDVRMDDWNLGAFVVGTDTPSTAMPCYQWKGIDGGGQDIQFNLTADQVVDTTVKVGITVAYAGARPNIDINGSWTSAFYSPSSQPSTRTLTVGTYRGNNTDFTFTVPASALHTGSNTLRVYPISGSGYPTGFLSAGYSLDYVQWQGIPATLPEAPTGLESDIGNARIELAWNPVPSATRYIVQRAAATDGPYTTLSSDVGPAHFTDTSATNGTAFFYRVSAVNALGEGASSDIISTASQLATYYTFNETSGSTAIDSAGSNDGTLMSGASLTNGLIANAVQLDGSTNGYVELPDGIMQNLTNCTISTWINASSTPTWSRIFDFGMGTESYMMLTPNSGSGNVRFAITISSNGGEQALTSSSALPLNGWHHVAVTLSGDTGKLYIDGSLADTQTIALNPADLGLTRHDFIGKSQWNDPYPTAKIDDFRIYSRALTDTEISKLASISPPDAPTGLNANASSNRVTLAWSASNGATTYNVKRAATSGGPYDLVAGGLTSPEFSFDSALEGTNYFVVSASNIAGDSANSTEAETFVFIPLPQIPPVTPIAYYRFEDGSAGSPVTPGGNVITDSAGSDDNMNTGSTASAPTYSANVPMATIPQTGSTNTVSTYFDGSDDLYNAFAGPLVSTVYSNFTVEAYVNFSSLSGFETIVGRDDQSGNTSGGVDGNPQALFYLSKHSDNHFRVEVSTVGGDMKAVEGNVYASAGTWYHLAAVGDASKGTLTLYVNGVQVGSITGFDGLYPTTTLPWTIGRGQYNGAAADHVSGYIDEVRITPAALSTNQFLNTFNPDTDNDGLADAWEMQYFGNLNQTATGDPDGDGIDNLYEQAYGTDPTISSIPPNIGVAINNGVLNLSWPSNNTGWRLLYRTNLLSGTWQEISGSDTNNVYGTQINTLPAGSVFYKLVYP